MKKMKTSIRNGDVWLDTDGHPIHAHGGGFLKEGEYYYWFGEDRRGRNRVSCYRSNNLTEWEYRGNVLTLDARFEGLDMRTDPRLITDPDNGIGANIERPKVLRNPKTGTYVMWMHWENGRDYKDARCAVAVCDTVDGEYVYRGSFNPIGQMSRDCTLFQDDDGTAYFISAARDNADLIVYRLSEDYLSIDEQVRTLWPGQFREAPAMCKKDGVYFLLTSACTGWLPNQGKYAYSRQIDGRWSSLRNFGGSTTYDSQPAFILPVHGSESTTYLYVGDRWDPSDYFNSRYVFLPLLFSDETTLALNWADQLEIDAEKGTAAGIVHAKEQFRLRTAFGSCFTAHAEQDEITAEQLSYKNEGQVWQEEPADGEWVRIRNKGNGKYLQASRTVTGCEEKWTVTATAFSESGQEWRRVDFEGGKCQYVHRFSKRRLCFSREQGLYLSADDSGKRGQTFLKIPKYS